MRVLALALKDIKALTVNKKELLLHILLPALIVLMVAALFGGEPALYGEVVLVNHDGEGMAEIFMERLKEERGLKVLVTDQNEAIRKLMSSEILMFTEIPAGFTETLSQGEPPEIKVYRRGVGGSSGQMLLALLKAILAEMSGEVQITRLAQEIAAEHGENPLQDQEVLIPFMESFLRSARLNPTVKVEEIPLGRPQNMAAFFISGVMTLFIVFTATFYAQNFVEEKNNKIMERYFFVGLSKGEILLGKFLGCFFRGAFQLVAMLLVAVLFTKVLSGVNLIYILSFSLVFIAAVSSVGIFIGAIFPKPGQALWASIIFTLINSALGNTFAFARTETALVNYINYFTISYYANSGLRGLITGDGLLSSIKGEVLILIFITALIFAVSSILFSPAENS